MTDLLLTWIVPLVTIVVVGFAWRAVRQARAAEAEALAQARRAKRIKDEFVSMVSHELRTPLTSIAGFVETLKESWQELPAEEVDEFLDIVRKQSYHLADLVEDILTLPRLEAGKLTFKIAPFSLEPALEEVAEMVFPPGGGKAADVSVTDEVIVWADRRRVQQVARNLMENARKYGGDQILIEGTGYGDHVLIVVADNGKGVPDDEGERIFGQFEQLTKGDARADQGIGLGLPIARKLARAMGGDVWYEPRFPTGSRFCFTVPSEDPETKAKREAAEAAGEIAPRPPGPPPRPVATR